MPTKRDELCKERMYRVQVAWDTYMATQSAQIAKRYLKTKKDKLIVFAGAMHMEHGLGIPLRFARLSNLSSYIISNYRMEVQKEISLELSKANSVFIYNVNNEK